MVRQEGASSLYRGLLAPVLGYGAINAVAFGTNARLSEELRTYRKLPRDSRLSLPEQVAIGGVAGFTQSFVRAPVEQVKTVMQASTHDLRAPFKHSLACAIYLVNQQGAYQGLFRGLIPTIVREVPQYAMYYPLYEGCKRFMHMEPSPPPVHVLLLAGGIAGALQWVPTFPLDVLKTRIQAGEPGQYSSVMDCATQLYKSHGVRIFWRGLSASLVRAFPLHGCIFVGYELTLKALA